MQARAASEESANLRQAGYLKAVATKAASLGSQVRTSIRQGVERPSIALLATGSVEGGGTDF